MLPCCATKLQPGQKSHLTITVQRNSQPSLPHHPSDPEISRNHFPWWRLPATGCDAARLRSSAPASTLPLCRSPTPSLARTLQYATHSPPRIFCRDDGTQIFGCAAISLNEATMAVSHSARNARTTSLHHWPLVLIHRATSDRNLKPRRLRKSTR